MSYNIRRPTTEPYDPKQRIVGGVVLFLIILLVYSILKILLSLSSAPEEKFGLATPLGDEITRSITDNAITHTAVTQSSSINTTRPTRRIPQAFVFLEINGNPMQQEVYQAVQTSVDSEAYTTAQAGQSWYVQAASFKAENRALALVEQIKNKDITSEANIIKKGPWYVVRLPPQTDRDTAERQRKELKRHLHVIGEVKEIE